MICYSHAITHIVLPYNVTTRSSGAIQHSLSKVPDTISMLTHTHTLEQFRVQYLTYGLPAVATAAPMAPEPTYYIRPATGEPYLLGNIISVNAESIIVIIIIIILSIIIIVVKLS